MYGLRLRARRVFPALSDRITRGDWTPGTKLPSHRDLAAEFGVAPLAMRQVLAQLEEVGPVSRRSGRGTVVREAGGPAVLIVEGEPTLEMVLGVFTRYRRDDRVLRGPAGACLRKGLTRVPQRRIVAAIRGQEARSMAHPGPGPPRCGRRRRHAVRVPALRTRASGRRGARPTGRAARIRADRVRRFAGAGPRPVRGADPGGAHHDAGPARADGHQPPDRHPLIIANLAASLERLAPGRSFLGLGTGFSGVRHAGAGPATLAGLASSAATIRELLAGDTIEADGARISLRLPPSPVPLLLAGSGPKSLRLAGQLADIALLAVGIAPDVVTQARRWVREGAEAAGRDPSAVECWAYVDAAISADRATALEQVTGAAVARAAIVFGGPARQSLPPTLREKAAQLVRDYDFGQHFMPGRTSNYQLAERLGIADELLARFPVAGTPDDCRRRLAGLRDAGIENVCLNLAIVPDVAGALRLFGERVLPALTD